MKKAIKNNIGFIMAIVFVTVVVSCIWNAIYSLKPPDKDDTEKYFDQEKNDLFLVTEYLTKLEWSEIYINKSDFRKNILYIGVAANEVKIDEEEVATAIVRLVKKRNYKVIKKNGNTIYFEKWFFGEECRGIAYSINRKDKPVIEYLTELEPLSENGWYYYEADYNEWRSK